MRHVYVHRAAVVLAVLLVVAAALFAWWRSRDLTLVLFVDAGRLEALAADDDDRTETEDWAWQVPGGSFYAGSCRGCHVRLTHVPELFAADGGRPYLIDLLLFGFEGEAPIDGSLERFDHPPFAERSDDHVAAVLNHLLVSWGNEDELGGDVALYRPEEVADARDRELTPSEVAERRPGG
jgi:hypothetical protein